MAYDPAGIVGVTEKPLIDWFASSSGGRNVVGRRAHYGYTAIALSRLVAANGRVFAFEPVLIDDRMPQTDANPQRPQPPHIGAAGSRISETATTASVPSTRGMADLTLTGDEATRTETIHVIRFDWLWPQIHGGNPSLHGIKIDVQGMELETLIGMRDTLATRRPKLVVELHRGVSRAALLDFLVSVGYSSTPIASNAERKGVKRCCWTTEATPFCLPPEQITTMRSRAGEGAGGLPYLSNPEPSQVSRRPDVSAPQCERCLPLGAAGKLNGDGPEIMLLIIERAVYLTSTVPAAPPAESTESSTVTWPLLTLR